MSYLIDTHCHIHDNEFEFDVDTVVSGAREAGVGQLICIGTSALDSQRACDFVRDKPGMWASVGLQPHSATAKKADLELLARLIVEPKVVAVGEFGLDYFYKDYSKKDQIKSFEYQLDLARSFSKPCIFHVREAFSDFWSILDNFSGLTGVVHSFTSTEKDLDQALNRGLYLGINGIITFTKDETQRSVMRNIPLDKLVLETDSPFLTPTPLRGKVNVPANVRLVAAYLAELRGETLEQLIEATTYNAQKLFSLTDITM